MNIKSIFTESTNVVNDRNKIIKDFTGFCQKHLSLQKVPNIIILDRKEPGMTTGAFEPQTETIKVLGGGRLLADILRTLAHELTHYRQGLEGKIRSFERDWDLEAEADIEAGKCVYTFAHSTPDGKIIYEL